MNEEIQIEDFQKLDIRIATITAVKQHPKADKLYILRIKLNGEPERQIVAGLRKDYKESELLGKQIAVIINLKPVMLRGEESNGMLLAAVDRDGKAVILTPDKPIENFSKIY